MRRGGEEAVDSCPYSAEGRKSVSTFKACTKFKDCYSGFVSTTMSPNDYMVSNAHCCQSDGCNSVSVPRKCYPNNRMPAL